MMAPRVLVVEHSRGQASTDLQGAELAGVAGVRQAGNA